MKRYIMEGLGTALLTVAVSFTGNPFAIGLMLATIVYIGGTISGGHYNPAVSLAVYLRGLLSSRHLAWYVVSQTIGALIALLVFAFITKSPFTPDLSPDLSPWISLGVELVLTSVLCLTVLTVIGHHDARKSGVYGLIIGLSLMTIAFIGGLFNPAIAIASYLSVLIHGGRAATAEITPVHISTLVHVAGPLLGSAAAAWLYRYLNGGE